MRAKHGGVGLGLDAGGTQTRWALADAAGRTLARGSVTGFSGQQALTAAGRRQLDAVFRDLREALVATHASSPLALCAGVSGYDRSAGDTMPRLLAAGLGLPPQAVQCFNDVELACRLEFATGTGGMVYAGTGSIAWAVDADGAAHHVGGRGGLIGDEGSGYWIAKRALAELWRREDDAPGSAVLSVLGAQVFAAVGGPQWDQTRRALAAKDRGELGQLALAVAHAAEAGDAFALSLLNQAGDELARLALLLIRRHGARRIALAGRVFDLHGAVLSRLAAALPAEASVFRSALDVAPAAARAAAASVRLPV
ncbi:MAG: ATPase [Rubrivivax sp.]|jgi:N-acetylglucosamine kinase-like BadF-type ATPase|nr:ATPase [Rubrivivax sp.]